MIKLENKKIMILISLLLLVLLPVLMELYFLIIEMAISPYEILDQNFFYHFLLVIKWKRIFLIGSLTMITIITLNCFDRNKVFHYLYQYRYAISGVIFLLLVLAGIHGSSIQYWQYVFEGTEKYNPLIGIFRSVRSDEWAVNTPMMLSQYFNHSGAFPYFSETMRGALTDAFIVYGQPVKNIAVIFRPFHWGYLLLSPENGLSFFWMGRVIGLFLVSFEFAMILCKRNKLLATSYAVLITWAPIVQWWFAVNSLVEMLIFGQLLIVMVYLYINTDNYYFRSLFAVIMLICTGGYILALYPAWQIPLFYVFLSLLIGLCYENRQKIVWRKKDTVIFLCIIIALGCAMGYIFSLSYDTILSVIGTVYPGDRFETGGGQFNRFFLYLGNIFFGTSRELPYANVCELSAFYDFFPMGILLALWVYFKEKKRDVYLTLFFISFIILSGYCLVQWPDWLAKISLLSHAQPARVFLAVGLINILLLIRSLTLVETEFPQWLKLIVSLILGCAMTGVSMSIYEGYIDTKMGLLIIPLISSVFYILLSWKKLCAQKAFLGVTIGIMFVAGMFVNPVVQGLDVIYNQDIIKKIDEVSENDNGLWIVDSGKEMGYPSTNIPIMVGAPTINSTNVYPNLERWYLVDPERSNEDIYNRYAHITVNLIGDNEKTNFVLNSADLFTVNLRTSDLKILEVRYVLSKRNLIGLSNEKVKFNPLTSGNGFTIYRLEYN